MADESRVPSGSIGHQSPATVWKRKYLTLQKRCEQTEQENERILNRIYHVNKLLRRYRRQRRFIREKLDEHKDDYQNAQPPLQAGTGKSKLLESLKKTLSPRPLSQLMAEIVSESIPSYMDFDNGVLPVSPGETSNATTASTKKSKSRNPAKQDKEKDPNAPKKPANAFFMFCQQQRNVMQDDQRDAAAAMGHHELTKTLAKEWNNLIDHEKKVYYEMYEKEKERYEQEMKNYTSDKASSKKDKDSSSKKQKSKAQKSKATLPTATVTQPCPESRPDLVSPTMDPLSQSFMPFNIPLIPSPPLLSNDKDTFQDFSELSSPPHDSFMQT